MGHYGTNFNNKPQSASRNTVRQNTSRIKDFYDCHLLKLIAGVTLTLWRPLVRVQYRPPFEISSKQRLIPLGEGAFCLGH